MLTFLFRRDHKTAFKVGCLVDFVFVHDFNFSYGIKF